MKTLFIGNGVNQLSGKGTAWSQLLEQLAGGTLTSHEEKVQNCKPFTLWFEELACLAGTNAIKKQTAECLSSMLFPNEFHRKFMALNCEHILTTNYDYNLEASTDANWKLDQPAPEKYYSLFRRHRNGNKFLWHIHGELKNRKSIMLGHDQYTGYSNKISNLITQGVATEAKGRDGKPYLSKFSPKNKRKLVDIENWVDIFLESELHIVGFGLDYTENHLWNLLSQKRRLRKNPERSIGDTFYYRCSTKKRTTADEAKASILNAFEVTSIDFVEKTRQEAYDSCLNSLRRAFG